MTVYPAPRSCYPCLIAAVVLLLVDWLLPRQVRLSLAYIIPCVWAAWRGCHVSAWVLVVALPLGHIGLRWLEGRPPTSMQWLNWGVFVVAVAGPLEMVAMAERYVRQLSLELGAARQPPPPPPIDP